MSYKNLNYQQKLIFKQLYYSVANKNHLFNQIRKSPTTICIWVIYVLIFIIFSILINIEYIYFFGSAIIFIYFIISLIIKQFHPIISKSLHLMIYLIIYYIYNYQSLIFINQTLNFYIPSIIGFFIFQKLFEITHLQAHTYLLDYDLIQPNSSIANKSILYFYEFYHHHHQYDNDWFPELSYHDHTSRTFILDHSNVRNIIAAHWHTYTLLTPSRILVPILMIYINPANAIFFSSYEIGVLLLPFVHGWQHVPKLRYGCLFMFILTILEYYRIIVNRSDHETHHDYNNIYVYQNFTSTGFFYHNKYNHLVNEFWNYVNQNQKSYIWLDKYISIIIFIMLIIIPIILPLFIDLINLIIVLSHVYYLIFKF